MLFLLIFIVYFSVSCYGSVPCINETTNVQLIEFALKHPKPIGLLTTSSGFPVSLEDTQTINTRLLLNDFFTESITHMVRERIPARVVHEKGAGAFGTFKVTHSLSDICKAKVFSRVGEETPVVARFAPSFLRKGGSDTTRDVRGFAVKFYTTEGNYDFMGLSTEMFLMKDPINFPAFVHAFHKNPVNQLGDYNSMWDFMTLRPETLNMFMRLLGDRGIPDGFRHMPGFAIHTFELINHRGDRTYAKFHMLPDLGIKNLNNEQAKRIQAVDLDYARRDLYFAIKKGKFPTWTLSVQTISENDVGKAGFDIFDITRLWPVDKFPLRKVGVLELNRNPTNHFADIEQVAFCPGNLVPGIRGIDSLFEARVFAYKQAHLYRLGVNHNKIPVNCPFRAVTNTYNQNGVPPVASNGGEAPNYYPNSFNGARPYIDDSPPRVSVYTDPRVSNFDQAGQIYVDMSEGERSLLLENIVDVYLRCTDERIQKRAIQLYKMIHRDLGNRVEARLKAHNGTECFNVQYNIHLD